MAIDKKRVISGFKTFGGKSLKFTGKYGLKALAKIPELAVVGGTIVVGSLAQSDQFQVLATMGGLVAATVAFPPVALGIAGMVGGKLLADKVLGKPQPSLGKSIRETLLLGNNVTRLACDKVISPASRFVGTKAKEMGKNAQTKVDDLFSR